MGKRGGDAIVQKSNKKLRELKNLGPILVEPEYSPLGWYHSEDGCYHSEDEEEREMVSTHHFEPNKYDDDDDDDYEVDTSPEAAAKCTEALEHYNKKNHTNYQVVDALLRNVLMCGDGLWYHCNFTAKKPDDDGEWLFFAELRRSNCLPARMTVTYCCILRGRTIGGCTHCSKVLHPTRGFRRGHVEYGDRNYKGPTLRPRPDKKRKCDTGQEARGISWGSQNSTWSSNVSDLNCGF